jgi:hypothetical protein
MTMGKKISRREIFKDSALMLGGFIMIGPAIKALAQTPSPLAPQATPGAPPNPVNEIPKDQDPAQNRTGDQFKRSRDETGNPRRPNIFQKGYTSTGYYQNQYYR